jgi:hypothetical protein
MRDSLADLTNYSTVNSAYGREDDSGVLERFPMREIDCLHIFPKVNMV